MRYIVDANILFSAQYNPDSNAGILIDLAIQRKVTLYSTEHVKVEMARILNKNFGWTGDRLKFQLSNLHTEWVEKDIYDDGLRAAIKKHSDEADASLLALGDLMRVEVITGDKALLQVKFRKVKMKTLKDAVDGIE